MNINQALRKAYDILKSAGIDTYMLDAQLLLQKVLNKDKLFITINRDFEISLEEEKEYFDMVELRKNKMPVKYILGECEFMGLNFNVREGVLIPRPDTEILVEEVIERIKENDYREICDVCCGSGAIGISIGRFVEDTRVYCCDISDIACQVTEENINKLGMQDRVKIFKSDLLDEAIIKNRKFDAVVSNPPYIKEEVIPTLMDDVKNYEPHIALDGGKDGLDFYRKITEQSLQVLNKGGLLAFEIGYDQGEEVQAILRDRGFTDVKCIRDLAGLNRVITGIRI
ncbi:peptide chain release factor N(5)-glutamine methyltransferase [Clostridium sp.]|uniref:peptide chain release factor N(5)-glutamine methyltransferase n=1 Tax=Clostridium sp. TaxID=1506 RepID=UPI0039F5297D